MSTDSKSAGTRADLVAAGLHLFGRNGFAGTSTRVIAAMAGTNVASIAYHFGGKDGLRLACGQEVLRRISAVAGPAARELPDLTPDQAAMLLEHTARGLVTFLARSPQAADTVGFVIRELAEDGPALALIYDEFFRHKHREICHLVGLASGRDPDDEQTKLLVFSLLGQAVYFRIGQPIIRRIMDWPEYGEAEASAIADRLAVNLHAILRASP